MKVNRRDFFKKLGLGLGAAIALPKLLLVPKSKEIGEIYVFGKISTEYWESTAREAGRKAGQKLNADIASSIKAHYAGLPRMAKGPHEIMNYNMSKLCDKIAKGV